MHIFIIALGFILWFAAYESKPIVHDGTNDLLKEENYLKRIKLLQILNKGF